MRNYGIYFSVSFLYSFCFFIFVFKFSSFFIVFFKFYSIFFPFFSAAFRMFSFFPCIFFSVNRKILLPLSLSSNQLHLMLHFLTSPVFLFSRFSFSFITRSSLPFLLFFFTFQLLNFLFLYFISFR